MLDNARISEILTSHPAVKRVTLGKEGKTSTIQTNASANLEPLLTQLGLVVTKTKRHQKSDGGNRKKLWPYWYQVRKAPPGSHVLDHDTVVALVCAKVLTLTQNDLPASIMNATADDVDVMSIWGNRYALRKIAKGLYLMRAELPFANIVGRVLLQGVACTQAGPGWENTDEA